MKFSLALALCLSVAACAVAPAQSSYDNAERLRLRQLAENGDREAQFHLGNAYCCGTGGGFWDTAESVKWWCKAAAQGQTEAAAAVARVGGECGERAQH